MGNERESVKWRLLPPIAMSRSAAKTHVTVIDMLLTRLVSELLPERRISTCLCSTPLPPLPYCRHIYMSLFVRLSWKMRKPCSPAEVLITKISTVCTQTTSVSGMPWIWNSSYESTSAILWCIRINTRDMPADTHRGKILMFGKFWSSPVSPFLDSGIYWISVLSKPLFLGVICCRQFPCV